MCGIGLCIGCSLPESTIEALKRRGPDFYKTTEIDEVSLYASILSHQGVEIEQQPIICGEIVLLFNGEIYRYRGG